MILEKYLIIHCSPTLAKLKTANLFTMQTISKKNIIHQINNFNKKLSSKSISLILFRYCNNTALIYVCRKDKLQMDLNKSGVAEFLSHYGYQSTNVDDAIYKLQLKFNDSPKFPHEIGLFLGYPLEDVKGFIDNSGKNYLLSGCWKVYSNKSETEKLFEKFKKCKDVYNRLWSQGMSIIQLTVAA